MPASPDEILKVIITISIVGGLGALLVEFCAGKGIDRLIDPICKRVIKRYNYVQKRDRGVHRK